MKLLSHHSLIKKLSFTVICSMLLFAACKQEDPDCYQSVLVRNFSQFKMRYLDTTTVKIDSFSTFVDTIQKIKDTLLPAPEMVVIGEDSAYRVIGKEINILDFPFNPEKESIRYSFRADTTDDTQFDTLTFFYTPTPHFVNNNCGYTFYYNLDSVKSTNHLVDSSYIVNPSLTDDNTNKTRNANVIFYFKRKP